MLSRDSSFNNPAINFDIEDIMRNPNAKVKQLSKAYHAAKRTKGNHSVTIDNLAVTGGG